MFLFWMLGLGSDSRTEEQKQKEREERYKKWLDHYKSLSPHERKREARNNKIILFVIGGLLGSVLLAEIIFVVLMFV